MNLGVSIVAHERRHDWALNLAQKLQPSAADINITWDVKGSVWDTSRRALMETEKSVTRTTHWLILQDDALICEDLIEGTLQALRYIPPESSLSLYLGRKRPFHAQMKTLLQNGCRDDISFIRMHRVNWGVGVVYPTVQIPKMLAYLDSRGPSTQTIRYDLHVSNWFLYMGIPVYYTWPSLIEHRMGESLMSHRDIDRQAFRFLGQNKSALGVDWSKGYDFTHMSNRRP